jgi:hypothetical protein
VLDVKPTPEPREPQIFGVLKLFWPKTGCPLIAVRDREER